MNIGIDNIDIVKKNSNNFSFSKQIINEIVNEDFKTGISDYYNKLRLDTPDTSRSYIWTALSGVTDEVGEILYENVLNYIDNVSDIDTCKTKALQSMVKFLGTNYNLLDGINDIPLELVSLIDVFSMRRECLVNSHYVNLKLAAMLSDTAAGIDNLSSVDAINECRATLHKDNSSLSTLLSVAPFVNAERIDKFMTDAFRDTIVHFLSLTYGKMVEDKPIVEVLSDSILSAEFELPNNYKSKIDEYKVRWHIPPEFNEEDAVDDIEAGLSTIDDYLQKYQGLLSIEYERECAPLNKLEPMTRYAFFKEKKVKEYYDFVKNLYLQLFNLYSSADTYDVDTTYLDLTRSDSIPKVSLLNSDGVSFNTGMINAVVKNLVLLVHKIQDLREYLKSHAQRTYMKGTFLLISYAVNEYLKQNVYPTMQQLHQATDYLSLETGHDTLSTVEVPELEYNTDENVLKLTEYIDLTQYFNIRTEIDSLSTKNYATLNGKFWGNLNTTNGAGTFVDSTNVLKPSDKSQIVFSRSMHLDLIAEFYEHILPKPNNAISSGNKYVNNFLTSVFSSGADDSWWNDLYKKVMATLSDLTYTVDIEDYAAAVLSAREKEDTIRVLSNFLPIEGATVKMQLDDAKAQYKESLSTDCDLLLIDIEDYLNGKLHEVDDALAQLETYYSSFENLESRCNLMFTAFATYTSGFVQNGPYLLDDINEYNSRAIKNLDEIESNTIIGNILAQSNTLAANHTQILLTIRNFCANLKFMSSIRIKSGINVADAAILGVEDIISISYSSFSEKSIARTSVYYEKSYDDAYNTLLKMKFDLEIAIQNIMSQLYDIFKNNITGIALDGFDRLSQLLSSYDFYNDTFSILTAPDAVSAALDYSNDAWYKYKKQLFMKYTGQKVGDTPYYYLENKVHPSYLIHPCLSNFIEKVDFSYPIANLGGMADEILQQYETTLADSLLEDGYLSAMWKNPLNNNSDYTVRYEIADHIDSNLTANEYFGWDGLIHPKIFTVDGLAINGPGNALDVAALSNVLDGQNLMEEELDRYKNILCCGGYATTLYEKLSCYDIKQYGLDLYGNSYILLSGDQNATEKQLDGTLWFRPKNIPIPFLAFAYTQPSMEEDTMSCCAFSHLSTSNTSFKKAEAVKVVIASGGEALYTPKVIDFNFTQDNSVLLVNCKAGETLQNLLEIPDFVVFGKILLLKDTNVPVQVAFLQDTVTRCETLKRPNITDGNGVIGGNWKFKGWFTQRTDFGAIYVADTVSTTSYKICVSKFDRKDAHLATTAIETVMSPTRKEGAAVFVDCDINGNIAAAYDTINFTGSFSTLADGLQYIKKTVATDGALSTYGDTSLSSIQVQKLQVAGNSIFVSDPKVYKPMQEAGFILATENTVLYRTGYMDELEDNKVLKFRLAVPAKDANTGIDFRHVCPVRQIENYLSGRTDKSSFKEHPDYSSYHYGNNSEVELSGVISGFSNVHFFESVYNLYLATMDDEQYYELVKAERLGRHSPNKSEIQANLDYLQLAHYDVSKYLSALRSEEPDDTGDLDVSDRLRHRGLVRPFMMLSDSIPWTYEYGIYRQESDKQAAFSTNRTNAILSSLSSNTAVITLGENEQLSVQWLVRDDKGTIKLDFNTALYLSVGAYSNNLTAVLPSWQLTFSSILNGQDDSHSDHFKLNERNKRHMFLNLDRPGEAGILNTWCTTNGVSGSMLKLQNTWLIKNISESNIPKFVIAKVSKGQLERASQLAGIEFNKAILAAGKVVTKDSSSTYLLAAEGPELRYISFE